MTIYLIKSLIAVAFIALAFSAALSMLILMGRPAKRANPEKWRRFHRLVGYLYGLFLLVLSALGVSLFVKTGDFLPPRGVVHAFIGLFLLSVFFLKWLVARFFRQFLRIVPTLGMAVFVISIVSFSMAGYFFLRAATSQPLPGGVVSPDAVRSGRAISSGTDASVERGSLLFEGLCSSCHYPDRKEIKHGPGLKGLFELPSLPYSGKPVTEANVREQLLRPAQSMPSFSGLSDQELTDLLAYLKTI
jgi:cytochrome c2